MHRRGGRTQLDLYERSKSYQGYHSETNPLISRDADASRLWKGLLSGLIAGMGATWVMTRYQVGSQKVIQKVHSREQSSAAQEEQPRPKRENPTVQLADRIALRIAGRGIPAEQKELAGNLVHYGFGTIMGGCYGILRELWPASARARGLAYGGVLWAVSDEIVLPALGLAGWAPEYPPEVHANALGAHLTYGFALHSISFAIRPLFDAGLAEKVFSRVSAATGGLKQWEEAKAMFRLSRVHLKQRRAA